MWFCNILYCFSARLLKYAMNKNYKIIQNCRIERDIFKSNVIFLNSSSDDKLRNIKLICLYKNSNCIDEFYFDYNQNWLFSNFQFNSSQALNIMKFTTSLPKQNMYTRKYLRHVFPHFTGINYNVARSYFKARDMTRQQIINFCEEFCTVNIRIKTLYTLIKFFFITYDKMYTRKIKSIMLYFEKDNEKIVTMPLLLFKREKKIWFKMYTPSSLEIIEYAPKDYIFSKNFIQVSEHQKEPILWYDFNAKIWSEMCPDNVQSSSTEEEKKEPSELYDSEIESYDGSSRDEVSAYETECSESDDFDLLNI
ncbi:hypothetical protein NUSPORA_02026 [Nucleospora cyclopteri]